MVEVQQLIESDELIELVPHKGKMFLLTRVTQHDIKNHTITVEKDVDDKCIFYEDEAEGIPTWAGFELAAQGVSALTGITNKILGLKPNAGFVLSVGKFISKVGYFKKGETIVIEVKEEFRDDVSHAFSYGCEFFRKGESEPIVTTKITVMEVIEK